jgi:hypothetical protein
MKFLLTCLFLALLFTSTGCITSTAIDKAKPEPRWNPETKKTEPLPEQPGYYALLPLTIPADVVTSPFQLIGYCFFAWEFSH